MGPIDVGGIVVAVIAALGGWAAKRSAAKAQRRGDRELRRLDAEHSAYERARDFDTDTISYQRDLIKRLRERISQLERQLTRCMERKKNEDRQDDDQ